MQCGRSDGLFRKGNQVHGKNESQVGGRSQGAVGTIDQNARILDESRIEAMVESAIADLARIGSGVVMRDGEWFNCHGHICDWKRKDKRQLFLGRSCGFLPAWELTGRVDVDDESGLNFVLRFIVF